MAEMMVALAIFIAWLPPPCLSASPFRPLVCMPGQKPPLLSSSPPLSHAFSLQFYRSSSARLVVVLFRLSYEARSGCNGVGRASLYACALYLALRWKEVGEGFRAPGFEPRARLCGRGLCSFLFLLALKSLSCRSCCCSMRGSLHMCRRCGVCGPCCDSETQV